MDWPADLLGALLDEPFQSLRWLIVVVGILVSAFFVYLLAITRSPVAALIVAIILMAWTAAFRGDWFEELQLRCAVANL